MRRHLLLATALAVLATTVVAVPAPAATPAGVSVKAPATAQRGMATAITLTLPRSVAAVDGRVLFQGKSVEVLGVATIGGGTGIQPVPFKGGGGASFGAYGLKPTAGAVRLQIVVIPKSSGRLGVRVVIDSAANRAGNRISAGTGTNVVAGLSVGRSARSRTAPSASVAGLRPTRSAAATAELVPDGRFNARDTDTARLEWSSARERGQVCGTARGDANGDGCTDIVDVQATKAKAGTTSSFRRPSVIKPKRIKANGLPVVRTFVVTSTADTADAVPGDGACADTQNRCTLRAAMTEADYLIGDDRIEFDLPGSAPVTIQIGSRLPIIASRSGAVVIDAYTQKGASPNTASVGSNAIPGVELRGNGSGAREVGFRITSSGNVIRGFAIREMWRGVLLDGVDAKNNRIIGNWIGYTGAGGRQSSNGQYGILVNQGANNNRIGTPDLADRNVIGNFGTGIDLYGPGVDFNVIQNNLFCITPGGATATCSNGVDHNFGPKSNTTGGDDPNEKNVFGPTLLQGIELSHGWDPNLPYGSDTATTYQINNNKVTGNWVGFRADGSYSASYRSGLNASTADNAQGINVYDGSNDNIIQRNHVASVYDGIQLQTKNAVRNIVRGNVIGESPQGEDAPLTGWGIVVRWGTTNDIVSNNLIRNAAKGGIGLLKTGNGGQAQAPAYNIRISRNIVKDTSGIGIDLFGTNGADPNDPGDADKGANTLLNSPVVTYADVTLVRGTATKNATVEVFRASRAAGANGLPVEFLGDTQAGSDGTWSMNLDGVSAGDRITTLQIRPDNTTSELSPNVALAAAPGAGEVIAEDGFARTVASGWGTADKGGAWTAPAAFSVAGNEGKAAVAAGSTRQARLAVGTKDVWLTGRVSVNKLPAGGNTFGYILARADASTAYRGVIKVAPSGNVLVAIKKVVDGAESAVVPEAGTGIVLAPDANLRFRFEVVGTDLRFKVWEGGTSEPAAWNATGTDGAIKAAAAAGFAGYTGSPVTNGPITWSFDDFTVQRGS
jgi:CSLREA domain-containing protein